MAQSPRILTPAESVSTPSDYSSMIPMNRIAPIAKPLITETAPPVSVPLSASPVKKTEIIQKDNVKPVLKTEVVKAEVKADKPAMKTETAKPVSPAPVLPPKPAPDVASPPPAKVAPEPKAAAKPAAEPVVKPEIVQAAPLAPAPVAIQWDKPAVPPAPVKPAATMPAPKISHAPAPIARKAELPVVKSVTASPPVLAAEPVAASAAMVEQKVSAPAPLVEKPILPPAKPAVVQASPPSPVLAAAAPLPTPVAEPVVAPATAPVAVPVKAAEPAPVAEAPKEKLGSMTELDAFKPDVVLPKAMASSGVDDELQASLLKKIQILESEKENMRKKLNQFDPGGVGPVYQCAAETNKINMLEGQVKFLSEENQALKKKNQELGMIPKLPEGSLDNLPDVKPETEPKESLNTNSGS